MGWVAFVVILIIAGYYLIKNNKPGGPSTTA